MLSDSCRGPDNGCGLLRGQPAVDSQEFSGNDPFPAAVCKSSEPERNMMKTLVIIPAYNEEENILNTLGDLRKNGPDADVLVVNDCSRDGTLNLLRGKGVNHLNLVVNLGIGGGVQAGYLYARDQDYDIAVQFDGDGQHEARYLWDLIAPLERDEADIAIGSRFLRKEGFQSSGARRAGINLLSGMIRRLCGIQVLDVTSGMRAVNRKYIEVYARRYVQDYPEPEALLDAGIRGARILEVPVQMKKRENGKSSISPVKSVYYMIKVSLALLMRRLMGREV